MKGKREFEVFEGGALSVVSARLNGATGYSSVRNTILQRRQLFRFAAVVLILVLSISCSLLPNNSAPRESASSHIVVEGETLLKISQLYGVSVEALAAANGIKNIDFLEIGQLLTIPAWTPGKRSVDGKSSKRIKLNAAKNYIGKLHWPIPRAVIGSYFGERNGEFHEGIDFPAKRGTEIFAAHDGRVAYSGRGLRGYGNMVIINSGTLATIYAHNTKNYVSRGDQVKAGELIATVGDTGRASGPHLHFETRIRDDNKRLVAIDPLVFYPANEESR